MPSDSRNPDEARLIFDLSKPGSLPGSERGGTTVVTTHGSLVFLTATHVFKVKRARDFGFFDYTTPEARRRFCEEEVRLNRRTAPAVYLGVLPVFEDDRGFSLTRPGRVADHAVHMVRLPDERSAIALVRKDRLGADDLVAFARYVANFYRHAQAAPPAPEAMEQNVRENFDQVRPFAGRFLDAPLFAALESGGLAWLETHRERLARRPSRDGHGDLRLEHVYILDDGPVLIDCIEFAERFRVADPALDVAFLAMDLRRMGRRDLAEIFLGRFAFESGDYDFYPLAAGYETYRAFVRGKVACFVAADPATPAALAARKRAEAAEFFRLAEETGRGAGAPRVVLAVGGIIAAGKSTVAEALARRLAVPIVSADATRKDLAGLRHDEQGGAGIYEQAFTERTQAELLRRADLVLESGRGVILDTTFAEGVLRGRARDLADRHGAAFRFVECRARTDVLRERLRARKGGLSDAREDLLDSFLARWEPEPEGESGAPSHIVLDTTGPVDFAELFRRLGLAATA